MITYSLMDKISRWVQYILFHSLFRKSFHDKLLESQSRRGQGSCHVPGDADFSFAGGRGNMDLFDAQVVGGNHAGEEAHAQVSGHEAGHGIGIVPFEDDFRMDASQTAKLVGQDAKAVRGLHGDEGIFLYIFQCHRRIGRQGMVLRDGDIDSFGVQIGPGQVFHGDHGGPQG